MLTRWTDFEQTFSMLDQFQRRMNQLFAELEPEYRRGEARWSRGSWPPVNLYDAGEELVLSALVPGLTEKDISITGNQDVLTISGQRTSETPEGYSVHRRERGSVSFSRSFTFPSKVDLERTSATVKDGVLTIKLGKAPEAKPRQIAVKAS